MTLYKEPKEKTRETKSFREERAAFNKKFSPEKNKIRENKSNGLDSHTAGNL